MKTDLSLRGALRKPKGDEAIPWSKSRANPLRGCHAFCIRTVAKSPESDDLSNFPLYIKTQAENQKKYAIQENVKKEVFLVVPSNTVEGTTKKTSFLTFSCIAYFWEEFLSTFSGLNALPREF